MADGLKFESVLKRPILTEKSTQETEGGNLYSFEVDLRATKLNIKTAIEKFYKVKVTRVHTLIVRGKVRRVGRYQGQAANWKKAMVRLAPGNSIELVEAK
ncbi:MAG: 50S ribosomal protein L23 [Deltaproteobacteria bacterium]|nr:50S ribosomal protein L23 [Deltaproteobacteria bacterium]